MKNLVDAGGCLSVGKTWECCEGSAAREVQKDVVEGRKSVEFSEGHSCHEFRLGGILYSTSIINGGIFKAMIGCFANRDSCGGSKSNVPLTCGRDWIDCSNGCINLSHLRLYIIFATYASPSYQSFCK